MSGALLWGYDATNKKWIPLAVDANGYVKVDISNIKLNDLADVSTGSPADNDLFYYDNATSLWKSKKLDGSNLSQTFGASAGRLRNLIVEPIAGEILRILNCGGTAFSGLIDDTPAAHGGQGLDATHVPYDGDSEEDMFKGMSAYDGSAYWGQIIVHNITRGNSRKIVSVDRTNNVIATTASTDDWADDDVLDTESQTVQSGAAHVPFVDVDVSDFVGTGVDAIILFVAFRNNVAVASNNNLIQFHPYETYNQGKRQWVYATLANDNGSSLMMVKVVSQKIALCVQNNGTDDFALVITVKGTVEFADT